MKPSWKRDNDHELEAALRASRPEPAAEVTQAIAERVRPRQGLLKRRIGRVPVVLVGGIAALALTPVVAVGVPGLSPQGQPSAFQEQYEEGDVVICVYGYAEHEVSQEVADELVAAGVAEYGPCPSTIFNP